MSTGMWEKGNVYKIWGMTAVLCLIAVAGVFGMRAHYVRQLQTLVGAVYDENPQAAALVLEKMFTEDSGEETVRNGKWAAGALGYTENAYQIYMERVFPDRGQTLWGVFLLLAAAGICGWALCQYRGQRREIESLIQRTRQASQYLDTHRRDDGGEFIFERKERTGFVREGLEDVIGELLTKGRIQKSYFEQRQRQMEIFMENVAHQVKTPLAGMLLNMELLQERREWRMISGIEEQGTEGATSRDARTLLCDSIRQGEKMRVFLKKLLDLARMEAGKIHFRKESVELRELLEEIEEEFPEGKVVVEFAGESEMDSQSMINSTHMDSQSTINSTHEEDDAIFIRGDRLWLYEALFNLADNGVKHGGEEGTVRIKVVRLPEEIKITVSDRGQGMTVEDREHLFERYYVGSSSDEFSSGIGLHLAQNVIQGHFGSIRAICPSEGGIVIEIRLPGFRLKEKLFE